MRFVSSFVVASLAALLLVGCGGDASKPAPAASASASAQPAPPAATQAASAAPPPPPSAAPSAAASAAPSSEPEEDPVANGPVHIHMKSAKVLSGKGDAAEKKLKKQMVQLRTHCIVPALKRKHAIDGTLNVTLEGNDGKITLVDTKKIGKIDRELDKCVKEFYEKKFDFDGKGKIKLEAVIEMGPKVKADK